jgi:hypothetical protein
VRAFLFDFHKLAFKDYTLLIKATIFVYGI